MTASNLSKGEDDNRDILTLGTFEWEYDFLTTEAYCH